MKIYFIPGLGFDNRIFEKLALKMYTTGYINWIEPGKNEGIGDYAGRMSALIRETEEEIILIGHSFGGIVSQEIARIRNISKVILISSIKGRAENPIPFKVIKPLGIHKVFTKGLALKTLRYWGKKYGYETAAEQAMVREMIRRHSNKYLQWALGKLSAWDQPLLSNETEIVQIHGDSDRTFPLKLIKKPSYVIRGGSHFMIYKKPALLSEIIIREIEG